MPALPTAFEALLARIETMAGARLPGSRRAAALDQAERDGIDVPVRYLETARKLADRVPDAG